MGESLTQRYRVSEEGLRIVKLCQNGKTVDGLIGRSSDGTFKGSTGQLRASSRGNTKGASVVRIYWA